MKSKTAEANFQKNRALRALFLIVIALGILCPTNGYKFLRSNTANAAYQKQAKFKLTISVKKKTKNSSIKLSGKTSAYASVITSVNGQEISTQVANRKGKFSVSAPLNVGANTVRVQASNGIATKTVSKRVVRTEKKKKTTNAQLKSFSKSLISAGDNETAKISKIYDWITANISYDWDKYNNSDLSWGNEKSPTETFDSKKGICEEYAELLSTMLGYVGVKSETVSGLADGVGGWEDAIFNNHSWNSVKLNGETLYLDSTWDAGREAQDYEYFLIPEKCISVDHTEEYAGKLSDSEQIDYVNKNSAYFDEYCPNLKSSFVSAEE